MTFPLVGFALCEKCQQVKPVEGGVVMGIRFICRTCLRPPPAQAEA